MSVLDKKNYQKTSIYTGLTIDPDWGNLVERALFAAYNQGGDPYLDNVTTSITRNAAGQVEQIDETVGGLLYRRTELSRLNGLLSSITVTVYGYDANGQNQAIIGQWVDTIQRANGKLSGSTRTVLVS